MTKEQIEAIAQFMRLVLAQLHPDIRDYGIKQMRAVEWSKGEEFEGTEYQDNARLQQAYYMIEAIEKLTGRKESF